MKETNYTISWETPYNGVDGKNLYENHFIEVNDVEVVEAAAYCLTFPQFFCNYISEHDKGAVVSPPDHPINEFVDDAGFEPLDEDSELPSGEYKVTISYECKRRQEDGSWETWESSDTVGFDTWEEADVAHRILKTREDYTTSVNW